MIDLRTLWGGIYENLHGFDDIQLEQIKQAVFYEVGKYDFQPKPEHTELVVYDDDKKGYTMFFVAKKVEGLADKSLKYYKEIIDKFFEMIPKPLNILTSDDIRFYLARRQIERKCSPATMDNERRILHTFFRWLSDEGYIDKNICSSIKKVRTPKRKKKAFSETDCAKIRDACFSLDGNHKVYAFSPLGKEIKTFDGKWDKSGIEIQTRNIGKIAGVKNCHPHRFRRTAATFAIKKGMSLLDVQRMLGHACIETTKIYLDLDDSDLKYQHDKFF